MADRVVIVDVRRAAEALRPRDIKQMCGRAGRMHGQEEANVHVILGNDDLMSWKNKFEDNSSYETRSTLSDVSTFAFHAISQIVRGTIHNKETFLGWYDNTLDRFQKQSRSEEIPKYEDVAQELHDTGAAEYDSITGEIKAKPLGKICAAYYFSPYDVRDWFSNITALHKRDLLYHDVCQAWAIANTYMAQEWDSESIRSHTIDLCEAVLGRGLNIRKGTISRLLAVHCALMGRNPRVELPCFYSVKMDLPRIFAALRAMTKCCRRIWGDLGWFINNLEMRYQYGVPTRLTRLVALPGIGKTVAKQLNENFDISSEKDLVEKMDFIRDESSPGVKRALTNYKKSKSLPKNDDEDGGSEISYEVKESRRKRRGKDEYD
jgi:replicative superfamily II helicase